MELFFYTADTAIPYVKTAAKKFVENVQEADGTNYLAIVTFHGDTAAVVSDFSTDPNAKIDAIESLSAQDNTRSVATGLQCANDLIDSIDAEGALKNVVLFTTGMTNAGDYSYSGPYNEDTVGNKWHRKDTQVKLYAYANSAYAVASTIKNHANLYTIGLFQTTDNMPSEGKEIVDFFKLFTLECATSPSHFYDVKDPNDLEFIFGQVAVDLKDSDGDGLPDVWELEGVTIDGEFIDLPAMGANPNVPDIFVEVDWMVKPKSNFLWFETSPEISLAPSENAMRMVYNVFKDHGIQLHIDVGPDSTDFVTGKTWGNFSGGNEIPYESSFDVVKDGYSHWNDVANNNFSSARTSVFKYCLFIDTYDGGTSSGIANNIPGQYFIAANQKWVRNTGDTGVAGTFMHELGHTLGLCHGGHTDTGEGNHTRYKPNYLSIMNYLFQTTGLVGTNEINYSEYRLPDLDENSLDENAGIDPNGLTVGTDLGTKFKRTNIFGTFEHTVQPVAFTSVDFNGWWGIDSDRVSVDLNGDGNKEILTASNDWDHIDFKGGNLGKEYAYIAGMDGPGEDFEETLQEAQLQEFIDAGTLGNKGAGSIESVGPVTVLAGISEQNFYIRVTNLTTEEETYHLSVDSNDIVGTLSKNVTIAGSDTELHYVDIPVPLVSNPIVGNYQITARLSYPDRDDVVKTFPVEVYNPSEEEKEALIEAIENDELDDLLPEDVIDAYQELLDETPSDPKPTTYTVTVKTSPATGGTVSGGGSYDEGKSVTVKAVANSNYRFVGWTENGTTISTNATYEFTAEANRSLTAVFEPNSSGDGGGFTPSNPSYQITTSTTTNGTVTVTPAFAKSGTKITITATPNDGYTTDSVTVTRGNGNSVSVTDNGDGTYTFTMPASQVTVSVTFVAIEMPWVNPFTDVFESDWFYDGVAYVAQNGLMQGVGGGKFNPSGTTTRGMIVTILYRLEGEPTVSQSTFTDVATGQWYTDAVAWAAANKIVEGYGNNTFGPNDDITREQMATILYRYAVYQGYDVRGLANLSGYTDVGTVSDWALTAMRWANSEGLITGRTTTTLVPKDNAIRAEAATIFMRFCQDVAGLG